jgi:uncharacterized OB-fold protein
VSSLRPRPVATGWSEQFWTTLREEGVLLLQRCADCRQYAGYPKIFCPHCYSDALEWERASGRGTIYTFSTVEANPPSTFLDELPYTIAIVDLEEGPRFLTRLVDVGDAEVRCGLPVELAVERVDDELAMPLFRPA